jgi:hypothetical protein
MSSKYFCADEYYGFFLFTWKRRRPLRSLQQNRDSLLRFMDRQIPGNLQVMYFHLGIEFLGQNRRHINFVD